MYGKKAHRPATSVNAGSMADIAFLLLIFFLVTTTILNDKGILVKLPPFAPTPPEPVNENLVLSVRINALNQLLVEKESLEIDQLRQKIKDHILNPGRRADLPPKPALAVISLQNDRGTAYETYLAVYNEIKAAYHELWDAAAQNQFGKPFDKLDPGQQRRIKTYIPQVISEAEPTDFSEK